MRDIERRLSAAERRLRPATADLPGTIEIHWRDAWPACMDADGIQQCEQHAPTCGVSISRTRERRTVVIEMGGAWLGV